MKKLYEPETRGNKIFMFVGNVITIVSGIIGFISWIIREITKKYSSLPNLWLSSSDYVLHFCIVAFIISFVCLISRIIVVTIKNKAASFYIQRKLIEFVHQELIHKIRNNVVELEPLNDKIQKFAKDNNMDAISECYNNELKELKQNIQYYVDQLEHYLSQYREDTISVCIKIFRNRDRNRNEFQEEEIITLTRSSNTESERESTLSTFVGQNTDFTNLCLGRMIFFGSSDLSIMEESGQYINDSENWKKNKYVSTLVTPIRYYNDDFNNTRERKIEPDIIGFLCIDSEKIVKEWEHSDSFELQMLAAFADILYVYLKEFYKCFENNGYNLKKE